MEERKNNNLVIVLLGIIIIILGVLCVLFATGKISFNNSDDKKDEIVETPIDNDKKDNDLTEDISSLPEWVQYVFNKNITKIEYTKYTEEIPDNDYSNCPKVEITKNDLAKVYREMSNHELVKSRTGIGFAGVCYPEVTAYFSDGYVVSFLGGMVIVGGEKQETAFIDALDKSTARVVDNGDENSRWIYNFANFDLSKVMTEILNK